MEDRFDVFLSHSSVDRVSADRICTALRGRRLSVFYSKDDIVPGQDFTRQLADCLKASRNLCLLVSHAALQSKWVREEVDVAVREGIKIIPLLLAKVDFEDFHPIAMHVKYLHYANLYGDFDAAIDEIVRIMGGGETGQSEAPGAADTLGAVPKAPAVRPKANPTEPAPSRGPDEQNHAKRTPAQPEPDHRPSATLSNHRSAKSKTTVDRKPENHASKASSDKKSKDEPVDPDRLIEQLTRDVDRGDREAAYFLSRLYASGLYVNPDDGRAVRYLQLAAQGARGRKEAMHDLAEMYRLGKGVGKNPSKAISLHEDAARRGYGASFYRLGRIYQDGEIAERDHARAWRRFAAAAELEYAPGHFRLAEAHLTGTGTDQDVELAYTHAIAAADKHYPPALNLVGRFHRKGIHVEQDDAVACDWYEKAMLQGSPEGAYNLASMYRRGLGRPRDGLKARQFFDAASQLLAGANPDVVLKQTSILVETEGGAP
ncbi:MAG: toll/interleukin-1 receptor domain-containing protein [Pseudomonadota bacterium]